jgi:hypothetical protein
MIYIVSPGKPSVVEVQPRAGAMCLKSKKAFVSIGLGALGVLTALLLWWAVNTQRETPYDRSDQE